jgi:hypothetical protein
VERKTWLRRFFVAKMSGQVKISQFTSLFLLFGYVIKPGQVEFFVLDFVILEAVLARLDLGKR